MTAPITFKVTSAGVAPVNVSGATLDEISRALPEGTYTTMRTYGGRRFLDMPHHLSRLADSLRLLDGGVELDETALRRGLADALAATRYSESRVRVTIPLAGAPIYISVEPFAPYPPELYRDGVRTITLLMARQNPKAKATSFIAPSRELKSTLPPGIHEVLMVDGRGDILEGFSSNFFGILDGELRTAEEGVLAGVTRGIVLQAAQDILPLRRAPVNQVDIERLSEAFITSASREVMPVVAINDAVIGGGKPGPLTEAIGRRFAEIVAAESEPPV